jgi:hypothetical protein
MPEEDANCIMLRYRSRQTHENHAQHGQRVESRVLNAPRGVNGLPDEKRPDAKEVVFLSMAYLTRISPTLKRSNFSHCFSSMNFSGGAYLGTRIWGLQSLLGDFWGRTLG